MVLMNCSLTLEKTQAQAGGQGRAGRARQDRADRICPVSVCVCVCLNSLELGQSPPVCGVCDALTTPGL